MINRSGGMPPTEGVCLALDLLPPFAVRYGIPGVLPVLARPRQAWKEDFVCCFRRIRIQMMKANVQLMLVGMPLAPLIGTGCKKTPPPAPPPPAPKTVADRAPDAPPKP